MAIMGDAFSIVCERCSALVPWSNVIWWNGISSEQAVRDMPKEAQSADLLADPTEMPISPSVR